ncbi:hypothetical protein C8R47DRAFT_1087228 [Mycena vitilis]|nr:hypothetical protein C8R47DRAFT_1087228 [Mycena vitilis]
MSAAGVPEELDPESVELLFRLAVDAQTTALISFAFFILLVYDYLTTLDKEVEFIWSNPKPSLARYIYIWNRYFSLVVSGICATVYLQHVNDNDLCTLYSRIRYLSSTIIILTVDFILMLRVWILFGKAKKLLFFIAPWLVVETAVMLVVGELAVQNAQTNIFVPFVTGCYSLGGLPPYFFVFALPSLILGFVMFCLTVYNCHVRLEVSFTRIHDVRQSWMPIATLFLRDGIYWFGAVIAVNPVQILLWQLAPVTLSQVLMVPSTVVYSIIGSRVLLNLMDLVSADVVGVSRYSGRDSHGSWSRV